MAKEFSRSRRVADEIQRNLAELIQLELSDPRLGMVTVTAVEVTPEFERARVFYSVMGNTGPGNKDEIEASGKVLNNAAGFLRRALAKRLKIRTTPELTFVYDTSLDKGARMDALIKSAVGDGPAADNQKPDVES